MAKTPPNNSLIQSAMVIVPDQLNKQPDGIHYTASFPRGQTTVLSIQPNGDTQTRPQGTNGDYELCVITSRGLKYTPVSGGPSYWVAYVPD